MEDSVQAKPQEEELQPQTYDDKLAAEFYKDHSSQNQAAIQLILVLSASGISYGKEVVDGYNILKKPLDPKKLVEDAHYKKRVERALQLVQRHEGKRLTSGKSKYTKTVKDTKLALTQVKTTYGRLDRIWKGLSNQYGVDVRNIYGFGDKELESVYQKALQRMKDRPQEATLQEVMREEAHKETVATVKRQVDEDESIGRFQKKREIKKRIEALDLTTKHENFIKQTTLIRKFEKDQHKKILGEGTQSVSFTLGVEVKPEPAQAAIEKPSAQPSPQVIQQQPVKVDADRKGPPPPFPRRKLPSFKPSISIPKIKIPKLSFPPSIGKFFTKLSSLRNVGSRLMSTGLKKAAGFLGRHALIKGLGGLLSGGTLTALSAASDVLKRFTGIDVEGTVIKFTLWAAIFVVAVPVGILLLVIFGLSGSSSSKSTSLFPLGFKNALRVEGPNLNKSISLDWKNFEEKYLPLKPKATTDPIYVWKQFEKEFLNPHGEYISLEKK